jgi:haloalkane dehalogenase
MMLETWAYLETWEKPFLTVFGDQDPIAFAPGAHLQFQRQVPGAQGRPHVVLEGPNHFIQEDAPDELVSIVDAFVRD